MIKRQAVFAQAVFLFDSNNCCGNRLHSAIPAPPLRSVLGVSLAFCPGSLLLLLTEMTVENLLAILKYSESSSVRSLVVLVSALDRWGMEDAILVVFQVKNSDVHFTSLLWGPQREWAPVVHNSSSLHSLLAFTLPQHHFFHLPLLFLRVTSPHKYPFPTLS